MTPDEERDGNGNDWTLASLRHSIMSVLNERHRLYTTQFESIKESITVALNEKEKAVNAAFAATEKAVSAALTEAKDAMLKAETASEKRFDGVHDLITREMQGLSSRFAIELKVLQDQVGRVDSLQSQLGRVDTAQMQQGGERRGQSAGKATIIAIVSTVITVAMAIYALTRK